MASDIEFKWRNKGFYDIRSSPGVVAALENMGNHVRDQANSQLGEDGYEMSSEQGPRRPQGRWHVRVYTRTNHAKAAEARHHILDTIIGGGTDNRVWVPGEGR